MKVASQGSRSNADRLPGQADVVPNLIDISRPLDPQPVPEPAYKRCPSRWHSHATTAAVINLANHQGIHDSRLRGYTSTGSSGGSKAVTSACLPSVAGVTYSALFRAYDIT